MELFNLVGKTAVITGASSGLGEQFARCLAKAGARVILVARRVSKLQAIANSLKDAVTLELDITDKQAVFTAFKELEKNKERIDICINNAGIAKLTPVFELNSEKDFEAMLQTNVLGVWYVTQAAACHMKKYAIAGSIINIASVNGANRLRTDLTGYCASKAAVIQMTKALVGELSAENIRINCIIPGIFHTPLTDYKLNTTASRQNIESAIPLHFVGDPADLDATILYLASNKASRYVTGSCITVDGGVSWGG